jgi:hypothetical protein
VWYNIKKLRVPPPKPKICSILRPVKDSLGCGFYKIPCERRAIYIGEMCCTVEHTKEHQIDLQLYHPKCSAVAEDQGHQMESGNTMALVKLPHYISRVIREAIKISLHNNFNREGDYQISPAWKNIIHACKEQRGCHNHTQTTNHSLGL